MSDWYELIGQTPVRIDAGIIECARRFEAMDRRVAQTRLFNCRVSTVFLGLDHSFSPFSHGCPVLFETMVFWDREGGYEQTRCSTWLEAEAQHARMCAEVVRPGAVFAYVARCLQGWKEAAGRDLSRRWRELRGIEPTEMEKVMETMWDAIQENS